jgi:predicted ArsR family transcriptional regulator
MTSTKQSTEKAVLEALRARPQTTSTAIAAVTGRGRSTVGKVLAQLEKAGKIRREAGGHDHGRQQPDLWSATRRKAPSASSTAQRLRPGELDGLVLDYLRTHGAEGPLTPSAVAKALGRSSGAVGNCLGRLTDAKQARQISDRPRRFSAA